MRNIFFLICISLSAGIISYFSPFFDINFSSSYSEEKTYAVEIAKYKYPVYTNYFDNLDNVIELNGKNGEYRYFSGITKSIAEVEELSEKIRELGYDQARVVNLKNEYSSDVVKGILQDHLQVKRAENPFVKKKAVPVKPTEKIKMPAVPQKISSNHVQIVQDNMGRKMRGKEYHDYYYELTHVLSTAPEYHIELGAYADKATAKAAIQKLKNAGFTKAKIRTPGTQESSFPTTKSSTSPHYTIQIFAGKKALESTQFSIKGISRSYDQYEELYRYFSGDYDNYWVCRRQLREVRRKGYRDAFIVKL
ncbi:SPOR domain-containing protein [Marinifilum sp. RC60d5]|uniref:SPOR domain-containing protein n=1 Tax=Marinifilum sp. RC60d5 TaxID=3458414 RepID=UPI004036FA03